MDEGENVTGILIVEDDPHIRELAEFAARKAGFGAVITAYDGEDALRMMREMDTSLRLAVLTDLSMPRLNGHALIAALKRDPATSEVPVFMFSSSGAPNDRRVAMDAGCRAYFEKPGSLDGLVEMMNEVHAAVSGVGVQRG